MTITFEQLKEKYDERSVEGRIETHIKNMWSADKSSKTIYKEVNDFIINLRDIKLISSHEYEQFVAYNDLQKSFSNDQSIIAKINKNSTLEELHDMYNQIEIESVKTDLLSKILSIIKHS